MTNEIDWAALETNIRAEPTREAHGPDAKRERFPCQACRGTGRFQGVRLHQPRGECFACGGKGYFLTSERDRQQARQKRQDSKAQHLRDTRAAFDTQFPDISPFLAANTWSPFLGDLRGKLDQYGTLSERQVAAIRNTAAKLAERKARRPH